MSRTIETSADEITSIIEEFLDQIERDCQDNERSSDPKEGNNNPKNRHNADQKERYIPPIADDLPPVILWGPPGVGKSSIVASICARRNIGFVDVRLAQKDPVDMRGIPFPNQYNRTVDWYIASEWPTGLIMNENNAKVSLKHSKQENNLIEVSIDGGTLKVKKKLEDPQNQIKYGIIFFDELTAADENLQVAAYEMILDRKLGNEYKVPPGWYICAAGNRAEDKSVSKPMSAALANRFLNAVVLPDLNSWLNWADTHGVHLFVTSFLRAYKDKDYLHNMYSKPPLIGNLGQPEIDKKLQKGWPSPRSWERVSDCCKIYSDLINDVSNAQIDSIEKKERIDILWGTFGAIVKGLVGPETGETFVSTIKGSISIEKILPLIEAYPIRLYYQDTQVRDVDNEGSGKRDVGTPISYSLKQRETDYKNFASDRIDCNLDVYDTLNYDKLNSKQGFILNPQYVDRSSNLIDFSSKFDFQKYGVNGAKEVVTVKVQQWDEQAMRIVEKDVVMSLEGNDILSRFNNFIQESIKQSKNAFVVEELMFVGFSYYLKSVVDSGRTPTGMRMNDEEVEIYAKRAMENLYFLLSFTLSGQARAKHIEIRKSFYKIGSKLKTWFIPEYICNLKTVLYKKIGKEETQFIDDQYTRLLEERNAAKQNQNLQQTQSTQTKIAIVKHDTEQDF